MTSGAFTAAHLELIPRLERLTNKKIVTATTSVGTGETSIPNRLKRGEVTDVVIVADALLRRFIEEGLVLAEGVMARRPVLDRQWRCGRGRRSPTQLDRRLATRLLEAKSIGYSASVSGDYVTTELYQRLGIAEQATGKSHLVAHGERVGAEIARGELEIGFQQLSELLPVPGIAHITPLPPEVQKVSVFSAGVAASSRQADLARSVIRFYASAEAAAAVTGTGLEPVANP